MLFRSWNHLEWYAVTSKCVFQNKNAVIFCQSVSQSVTQSLSHSLSHSVSQSVTQSLSHSVSQCYSHEAHSCFPVSGSQPVDYPAWCEVVRKPDSCSSVAVMRANHKLPCLWGRGRLRPGAGQPWKSDNDPLF